MYEAWIEIYENENTASVRSQRTYVDMDGRTDGRTAAEIPVFASRRLGTLSLVFPEDI